jgi:hypothetical protein
VFSPEDILAEDSRTTLAEADNFTSDANGRPTGARITINSNPAVSWYDGLDPNVPSDRYDLYTVVNHELAHALGLGTCLLRTFCLAVENNPEIQHALGVARANA